MSMDDATTIIDDKVRKSVTIGLNPSLDNFNHDGEVMMDHHQQTERATMANEYRQAQATLKATGKLPISIDNKCLMSMQDGRDTQTVIRLFKTACLAYAPTDVKYREHMMTRA